jgi:S1-C subfamily serine protease
MDDESDAGVPADPRGSGRRPGFRPPAPIPPADGPTRPTLRPVRPEPRGFRIDPPPAAASPGTGNAVPEPSASVPQAPDRRFNTWRWVAAATAIAAVAVLVIAILAFRLGANDSDTADRAIAPTTETSATTPTTLAATDIYRQLVPSVVVITTEKGALGTGFVVTDTGTIMTANHVIDDGSAVSVIFADGTKTTAAVASSDKSVDIALLTPADLPEVVVPATLGGGVTVGSEVVAIGNQLGLADSTTTGVVSGLQRTAKTDAGRLTGLIQFDAAVNPGSSGGPLINSQGAVVGVVVSIADPGNDDSWSGIGFAVPIGAALGATGDGPGGGPQL